MGMRSFLMLMLAAFAAGCSGKAPTAPARSDQLPPPPIVTPTGLRSSVNGSTLCGWIVNDVSCVVQSSGPTGASILVTNASNQPVAVNLSVYQRFPPDTFTSQQFYAAGSSRVAVLNSGQQTVLTAQFPACAFQVDAYLGPEVLTPPHDPNLLLGYDHGGSELCAEVQPDLPPTEGLEGCTPGFWKNHPNAWPAPYTPNTPVNSVFSAAPAGPSLSDALRFQGGPSAIDKTRILLRAAVAALLNIAHSEIDYPVTVADLVAVVNDAILNGTSQDKTTLAAHIDALNNAGCPINGR